MDVGDRKPAILPNTKGSGIMVSDFVDVHEGYLKLTPEQNTQAESNHLGVNDTARVYQEYGAERQGY